MELIFRRNFDKYFVDLEKYVKRFKVISLIYKEKEDLVATQVTVNKKATMLNSFLNLMEKGTTRNSGWKLKLDKFKCSLINCNSQKALCDQGEMKFNDDPDSKQIIAGRRQLCHHLQQIFKHWGYLDIVMRLKWTMCDLRNHSWNLRSSCHLRSSGKPEISRQDWPDMPRDLQKTLLVQKLETRKDTLMNLQGCWTMARRMAEPSPSCPESSYRSRLLKNGALE